MVIMVIMVIMAIMVITVTMDITGTMGITATITTTGIPGFVFTRIRRTAASINPTMAVMAIAATAITAAAESVSRSDSKKRPLGCGVGPRDLSPHPSIL
jgi:hypothetical protein